MTAAVYARVSTEDQAERGYSLDHQREACARRARELGATDVVEFIDDGVSGSLLDRPALGRLRALVAAGGCQLVVVWDPDRFARKLTWQLIVAEEIEKAGVRLEFVNFEWKKTSDGRLFFQLRGAIAEYERDKIRQRTMDGRRAKARRGKLPAAFEPYGYRYDRASASLHIEGREAEIVRRMFGLVVEAQIGPNAIARLLTDEGVPTRRGAPVWHRNVVRQILVNPVYAGAFVANRLDCEGMGLNRHLPPPERRRVRVRPESEWIRVPVPAIVEEDVWRKAQEALARGSRLWRSQPRSDYLLSGLVTCGACGLSMCGTRRSNWGHVQRTYTCRRAWAGAKDHGCARHIPAAPIEQAVWERITAWLADPAALVAEMSRTPETGTLEAEIAHIDQELVRLDRGRSNVLLALERSLVPTDEGLDLLHRNARRREALQQRRAELAAALSEAQVHGGDPERIRALAGEWLGGEAIGGLSFDRRRFLVRQFVVGVTVHHDAMVMRARVPFSPAGGGHRERGADAPAGEQEDAQRGVPAGADRRRP
jgi:site-specific DNA recombinase